MRQLHTDATSMFGLFLASIITMAAACADHEDAPPSELPAGSTCGPAYCEAPPPTCPALQVPVVVDDCYTGACTDLDACDVEPPCGVLNAEPQCDARAECASVYGGVNCRDPQGALCSAAGANCTCEAFVFTGCSPAL